MTDLFLSDLHLDATRPGIIRLFLDFLDRDARAADRLYILGDLFESWVGDDLIDDLSEAIAGGLSRLSGSGTAISFLHGNRDFLLGPAYAKRCGMALITDPCKIQIDGRQALLCHGDTLCTDDLVYQQFRQQVRNRQWQQTFLAKPLAERLEFARQTRSQSATHTATASEKIMDVNPTTVRALMVDSEVDLLIHGHTHRPAVHDLTFESAKAQRIVLGDWYEQGSVLVGRNGQLKLETLELI